MSRESVPLLELKEVTRKFGGLVAVNGVSFAVTSGETVGIIGQNGSGKSTLANLMTGVYQPTFGRINLAGRDLAGIEIHELVSLGITRTFQVARVFDRLSVLEQVVLAQSGLSPIPNGLCFMRSMTKDWRTNIAVAEEILQRTSLANDRNLTAHKLPLIKRRFLEIARCLASTPRLMILDEPTAGMGADEISTLSSLLATLVYSKELSLIVIDHNIRFIESLCSRLIVIHEGYLIADGDAVEVIENHSVMKIYKGL